MSVFTIDSSIDIAGVAAVPNLHTMNTTQPSRIAVLCVAAMLSGCASHAVERFHARSEPNPAGAAAEGAALRVAVAPVVWAASIECSQFEKPCSPESLPEH